MRGIQREESGMTPSQQELLASIRTAMPAIIAGEDAPLGLAHTDLGVTREWDRRPIFQVGPSREAIRHEVCAAAEVTLQAMKGLHKARPLVRARQICFLLLCQLRPLSLVEIGKFMGRDHTTVIHGIRVITRHIYPSDRKYEADTARIYREAKRRLSAP